MQRSFKYRIYPNKVQREALHHMFNFCRFLYNSALEERIRHYKCFRKGTSYKKQANQLPEIKKLFAKEIENIHSQVLQQVLKQVEKSYKNFFNGTGRFPRFKNENRFRSICFPQVAPDLSQLGGIKLVGNKLQIYGLGSIKIKLHRPIQGQAKQLRLIKDGGQYYVSISCDNVPKNPLPKTKKIIGIDLGLNNFVTTDDGTKFYHPKPYKTAKEKLAFLNRKFAKKQKGSNNQKKAKKALQKAHRKIRNIRNDFQHKLANKIVAENDIIAVENLNIVNMIANKDKICKNKNILDAAWGGFATKIDYKAESADKLFVGANSVNTTRTCFCCRNIQDLTEKDRIYICPVCFMVEDRDVNAAKNIRRIGIIHAAT